MILPVLEKEGSLTSNNTIFDHVTNILQIRFGNSSASYNATTSSFFNLTLKCILFSFIFIDPCSPIKNYFLLAVCL